VRGLGCREEWKRSQEKRIGSRGREAQGEGGSGRFCFWSDSRPKRRVSEGFLAPASPASGGPGLGMTT